MWLNKRGILQQPGQSETFETMKNICCRSLPGVNLPGVKLRLNEHEVTQHFKKAITACL